TKGKPELTDVRTEKGFGETELLMLVGAAERNSEHPLAEAIVNGAADRCISLPPPESFEAIPGRGIKAVVDGKAVLVGTKRLMAQYNVQCEHAFDEMSRLETQGKTVMLVAIDGLFAGMVA